MIPHQTPFFLPLLYPALTWRIETTAKELYLTFDDGPVPGPTEWALDQLAYASARGTFFCIGDNIARHPQIFKGIISGGHTVGNHTVNHVNGWTMATHQYLANIKAFDSLAREAGCAEAVRLFRPPYGRITRGQIRALHAYRIVMWDVLAKDYDRCLAPEKCLRGTLAACRPGSIVVFHDSYKSQRNLEYVLPRLLDHFGDKGYQFRAMADKPPNL